MPLFTPLGIGSGLHFWGPMERKKEIFNDLMERVARDCEPASAELYILVCAGCQARVWMLARLTGRWPGCARSSSY